MRDPDRIPQVLALLERAWRRYPDQRLGQLVLNACRGCAPNWPDVFSVEDDALVAGLKGLLPDAVESSWLLYRAGEDGNRFVVETFSSRAAAEEACARYEARGHKQHYWIERADG